MEESVNLEELEEYIGNVISTRNEADKLVEDFETFLDEIEYTKEMEE